MALIPFLVREDKDQIEGTATGTNSEIFSSFVFLETKILDEEEIDANESDTIQQLELRTVLLSFSKSKNVVSTPVTQRKGKVKEYISDGDYQIRVSGSLNTTERSVAPYDQMKILDRFLSLGQSLEIAGKFLETVDVLTVVVLDYDIAEVSATRNEIQFRFTLESDEPIELEIREGEATS